MVKKQHCSVPRAQPPSSGQVARSDVIDPVDTVYLFGTGAVEGAWDPVIRVIARSQGGAGADHAVANWWLSVQAHIIHLTSSWREMPDEGLEARFGRGEHERTRASMRAADQNQRQQLRELKEEIAKEILEAQARGEIRARQELLDTVAKDAGSGRTAYLTANWDLALDEQLETVEGARPKVLHLHGDARDPQGMLLPGERPEELYREETPNAKITSAYWRASLIFNHARRIYVAGLSLTPLDAALGAALGMGLVGNQHPGELVVANRPDDLPRICRQLRLIAPAWSIRELRAEAR